MVKTKKHIRSKPKSLAPIENKPDSVIKRFSKTLSKFFNKNNNIFSLIHSDKLKNLKKFLLITFGYGLILNFVLWKLLGAEFSLSAIFAWGITYYFINDEFVDWVRRLLRR